MKTTLEIPDELYRAVKAKAALEGRPVTELVVESLRLLLAAPKAAVKRVEFPLIKTSRRKDKATVEAFRKAEEEMYQEEVARFVQLMRR